MNWWARPPMGLPDLFLTWALQRHRGGKASSRCPQRALPVTQVPQIPLQPRQAPGPHLPGEPGQAICGSCSSCLCLPTVPELVSDSSPLSAPLGPERRCCLTLTQLLWEGSLQRHRLALPCLVFVQRSGEEARGTARIILPGNSSMGIT